MAELSAALQEAAGQENVPATVPHLSSETAERDLGSHQGTESAGVSSTATVATARKSNGWKPRKDTLHVTKLMQKGLSNDEIADRDDVTVEKSAVNLRKIRQRAREHGLLPPLEADKRDSV